MPAVLDYDGKNFSFAHQMPANLPYPCVMKTRGEAMFSGTYPMALYGARLFKKIYPDGKATSAAVEVYNKLKAVEDEIANFHYVNQLEHTFKFAPYQHQKEAIEKLLHYERLALLFEQGLGKTYIALMAIHCLKELGLGTKSLVICPAIVFPSWLCEIQKYTSLVAVPYKGNPDERRKIREQITNTDWDIVVTTFDMLIEKKGTPFAVYEILWKKLTTTERKCYVNRWLEGKIINSDQAAVLLGDQGKASWLRSCASIIKKVPTFQLPFAAMQKAKLSESSVAFLEKLPFDNLVIDEASRCLDPISQRSKAVDKLAGKSKRCWLLSGTLCVGRPTDMYMPMNLLDRKILNSNWTKFKSNFCVMAKSNPHIITGYKNLDDLKCRITPHIFARTRSECLDLPERIFQKRYYSPTLEMVRLYNEVVDSDEIRIGDSTQVVAEQLVKITKCLQILNGFIYYDEDALFCAKCDHILDCIARGITQGSKNCKVPEATPVKRKVVKLTKNPKLELLREDLADCVNEKLIIWAWYEEDIKAIKKMLEIEGISFITARDENCAQKYETDDSIRVFLGQTAQGIGITLNAASCMIYYSHGAALEPRLQSMDRNYRIGQKKTVVVKDYLARGTIEETLVNLLEHKKDVKEFMQASYECIMCDCCVPCLEAGIKYLCEGCKYHDERLNAEKKAHLTLDTI